MKSILMGVLLILLSMSCNNNSSPNGRGGTAQSKITKGSEASSESVKYAVAIHGGAGYQTRESISKETDASVRKVLNKALDTATKILENKGTAGDAVVAAIEILENDPNFNAGKGAVFTHQEINELDASFMDGNIMDAGAVGGVTNIKNPIKAARAVMEDSPHVLLVGKGAEEFAKSKGIETVDPSYFKVQANLDEVRRVKKEALVKKHGTVGCVVRDIHGNLAAGTSTGGMTNKRWNRIGDSPIIGAGTYANNKSCAVSATGHGEFFIRYAVAHDISALMEYKGLSVKDASNHVINEKLVEAGGEGGVICVDKDGNIFTPFNTPGMYRGFATDKNRGVAIYKDEDFK